MGGPSLAQALRALFSLTSSRCNIKEDPRVSIRLPAQQHQEIFLPGLTPRTRYESFGFLVGLFVGLIVIPRGLLLGLSSMFP